MQEICNNENFAVQGALSAVSERPSFAECSDQSI